MIIRQATDANLSKLHALNQSEVPHVGDIDEERLAHLFASAAYFPVLELEGDLAGFVICLDQDADYDSLNFLWFKERYDRFFYVDRIIVTSAFRRRGLASRLYDACLAHGKVLDFDVLALEYNIEPPNPVSAEFHRVYGFEEVGRRRDADGVKEVSMQVIKIGDWKDKTGQGG